MISPKPNAPVYTLPRTFFNTHRSDIYPPANTPNSEDKAIEMVDIGPATDDFAANTTGAVLASMVGYFIFRPRMK